MIGSTISHYKILEKLGEGGMGVVYKAQDLTLDRLVALKFLSSHLSTSEQDKARFVQEAKAASAINHPNICTIYSIDEHEAQLFIAMEYVDGQTLREKKGTISFNQAIDIGIQIADGLAAAHEKGIVHRDIKPENIMIRKDGIAQIMDFGLAKLRGNVSRLTKEGSTVGTAGYMSPEQVQGQDADHRSDIFSFGVLLYELLTGQLPFKGVHETALAYEIVNVDAAPMSSIKPEIDPSLDAIVLECLEKDINERAQSIKQISVDLKRYKRQSSRKSVSQITASRRAYEPSSSTLLMEPPEGLKRLPLIWILGTVLFFLASVALVIVHFREAAQETRTYRASLLPQEKMTFVSTGGGHLAISPDGASLAFVARDSAGKTSLWIRPLDALLGQPLHGTDGAEYPFWSPDSRFIGFFAGGKLKKIEVSGGPPQTICDVVWGRGGTWNRDGVIVFSSSAWTPLYRVPAAGGLPTAVTKFDTSRHEGSHRWPHFLPDGKHFFFLSRTVGTAAEEADAIYLASLDSTETSKLIIHASSNMAYAAGYLLFIREQSLMAQPFDATHLQLTGDAVPIVGQIKYDASFNKAFFSASNNSMLVYQTGVASSIRQLVWFDRSGERLGSAGKAGEYLDIRLSPDGGRVAVALFDRQTRNYDLWIYELVRDVWTRFTFDPARHRCPIWSPDGTRIVFTSDRMKHFDIYQKISSGMGSEEILLESNIDKVPTDWSSDGKFLAFLTFGDPRTKVDSWILPLTPGKTEGTRPPTPFLQTEFNEGGGGTFSPDGRWIAYQSDENGKDQVYARPFPGPGGKWLISTSGGTRPHWRRDGKEIFYLSEDNNLMAAEIRASGSTFEVGTVRPLFKTNPVIAVGGIAYVGGAAYDVTADGKRFLVNAWVDEVSSAPITLVVHWDKELKKK